VEAALPPDSSESVAVLDTSAKQAWFSAIATSQRRGISVDIQPVRSSYFCNGHCEAPDDGNVFTRFW